MSLGVSSSRQTLNTYSITWTVTKVPKNIQGYLYKQGSLKDHAKWPGDTRSATANIASPGIPYQVSIRADYYDGTSGITTINL